MSNGPNDVPGPALDITVDGSCDRSAAHREDDAAGTAAPVADRDLARYGLGLKDVDDTDG